MLAHALLNELFNVFPILFHVKVCVFRKIQFTILSHISIYAPQKI